MSKLEVREIGPISGETEVRLAEGATAVGFGGGGKILQVVQVVKSDTFSTNNVSSFIDITGLSASITPSSIDSKILISSTIHGTSSGRYSAFRLMRDSEFVLPAPQEGVRTGVTTNFESNQAEADQGYVLKNTSFTLLDEPSTLSQINYKIQACSDTRTSGEGFVVYINRVVFDDNSEHVQRAVSNIILMEVSS